MGLQDIERRDRRVAGAAVRYARGNRATAAARLRLQAREALQGALTALADGAGDERTMRLIDQAARRIRVAGAVERGE